MQIEPISLPGVLILTPRVFADLRGRFSETWSRARLAEAGIDLDFVQDNETLSCAARLDHSASMLRSRSMPCRR